MLGSAYGWSRHDILTGVYPDELPLFEKEIRKRQLRSKLDAIEAVTVPNMEKRARDNHMDGILSELRQLEGMPERLAQLDRAGLRALRQRLGASKLIKVKG